MEITGGQSIQAQWLLESLAHVPALEVTFQPTNPRLSAPYDSLQKAKYLRTLVTEATYTRRLLEKVRGSDVVHVFTASYSSFYLTLTPLLALARAMNKPVILNFHDGRAGDHLEHSRLARTLTRQAERLVVPSAYLADLLRRFHLTAFTIPNMVDLSRFPFYERPKITPTFLHTRGLERHYNVECSLRAFAIVQAKYPDASLVVAHDGPLRSSLESLATSLRLRNVRFLGRVDPPEIPALYRSADIYIMSPEADNMPLSVVECFASGLPVISTATGGVPFLIEQERTGLLAPGNDPVALATAAFRLIEEDGLARAIARNAWNECQKYEPAKIAAQWSALYREVVPWN